MNNRLLVASLAAICVAAAHPALGQGAVDNKTAQELKKEDSVPPATGRSLPEQAGTTEPSSKAKSGTDENVFVNGVLTVPGAPTDVDTAPAKFSERTAADDRLPIVGYRLKQLSEAQRREIAQQESLAVAGCRVRVPLNRASGTGSDLKHRPNGSDLEWRAGLDVDRHQRCISPQGEQLFAVRAPQRLRRVRA